MKIPVAFSAVVLLGSLLVSPSGASFHLMQIEQVIAGVNDDASVQAIQLRMRAVGQGQVQLARLRVWDAAGLNPVLLIDFATAVPNAGSGARILVASADFPGSTDPEAVPDFTLTSLIPESYLPAGSMTFENSTGSSTYWRLSWGGDNYTGPTTGSITNDVDGEFGPPYPDPIPSSSNRALLFQGAAADKSTNNADDYALTVGAAVFTNNNGDEYTINSADTGVGEGAGSRAGLIARSIPNPFTAATRFEFELATGGPARLTVADVTGRQVAVFEEVLSAGAQAFTWRGLDGSGVPVAPGVYLYKLKVGDQSSTGRVVLVR